MTIGDRIKEARLKRRLTQEQLAFFLGTTKQTIYKYEHGIVTNIPIDRIEKLSEILQVPIQYLMGWDNVYENYPMPSCAVPVVGSIPAGLPILAEENIIGYEFADVSRPEDYFYLRVKGDSMVNAGINNGSLVLVHKQDSAEDGQIVVCLLNGDEATLKRFRKSGNTVMLIPENPAYAPILVPVSDFESGYARILGVAKKVLNEL